MPQFWRLDSSAFSFNNNSIPTTSPVQGGSASPPHSLLESDISTPERSTDGQPSTSTPVASQHTKPAMPDDDDSFKFVVANCEGVTGKKQLIENMLASSQPDVFIAVESKLDDSVYDSEFLPSTYLAPPPSRRDRIRGGGGIFIATKNGISATSLPLYDTDCEVRWVKIHLQSKKTLLVGVFYRPPKTGVKVLSELHRSIAKIRSDYPDALLFLGGDFNLPGIDWEDVRHRPGISKMNLCESLLSTAAEFHLDQVNLEPTRKKNVLELLFTSNPEVVISCSTGPGISDHDHIVVARCKLHPEINMKKPRSIQLFKKADWTAIKKPPARSPGRVLQVRRNNNGQRTGRLGLLQKVYHRGNGPFYAGQEDISQI